MGVRTVIVCIENGKHLTKRGIAFWPVIAKNRIVRANLKKCGFIPIFINLFSDPRRISPLGILWLFHLIWTNWLFKRISIFNRNSYFFTKHSTFNRNSYFLSKKFDFWPKFLFLRKNSFWPLIAKHGIL